MKQLLQRLLGRHEPFDEWMSEHYLSVGNRTGRFDELTRQATDRRGWPWSGVVKVKGIPWGRARRTTSGR